MVLPQTTCSRELRSINPLWESPGSSRSRAAPSTTLPARPTLTRMVAVRALGLSLLLPLCLAWPAQAAEPSLTVADAPYVQGGCTSPAYSYNAASLEFTDRSTEAAVGSGAFYLCNAAPGVYYASMDVFYDPGPVGLASTTFLQVKVSSTWRKVRGSETVLDSRGRNTWRSSSLTNARTSAVS